MERLIKAIHEGMKERYMDYETDLVDYSWCVH